GKAAHPIACAEGILEMKCDPNTCDNADDDENAERHPPSGADRLHRNRRTSETIVKLLATRNRMTQRMLMRVVRPNHRTPTEARWLDNLVIQRWRGGFRRDAACSALAWFGIPLLWKFV